MATTGPAAARHRMLAVLDQGVYSGSNFVFLVLTAQVSSPKAFGELALIQTLLSLGVAVGRYIFLEPALAGQPWRYVTLCGRRSTQFEVFVFCSSVCLVSISVTCLGLGPQLLALLTPVVLLQDHGRYQMFLKQRHHRAVVADVVWLAALAPLAFLPLTLVSVVAVWVAGASASLLILVLSGGMRRDGEPSTDLTPSSRRGKLLDFTIAELPGPLGMVLLASANVEAAGEFRVVLIPYGAMWVLVSGLRSLGIADHRRMADDARRRWTLTVSLLLSAVALGVWLALSFGSVEQMRWLFGESWPTGEWPLVTAGVLHVARGLQAGPVLELKASGDVLTVGRCRAWFGAAPVLAGLALASRGSAVGLLGGIAVMETVTAIALGLVVVRRRSRPPS